MKPNQTKPLFVVLDGNWMSCTQDQLDAVSVKNGQDVDTETALKMMMFQCETLESLIAGMEKPDC